MLTLLIIPTLSMLLTGLARWNWTSLICSFSIMTLMSMKLFKNKMKTWTNLSFKLGMDSLSTPLIILSCWLAPLCFLAKKKIKKEKANTQKSFLILTSLMIMFLLLTFSSLNILSFFMCFEATLMPTLILMTRLGANVERLQAGLYFLFYTLFGSLPLLMSILLLNSMFLKTKFTIKNFLFQKSLSLKVTKLWWLMTILAFLVKMPIYGFHLWLPKAHVEAPVAGSMMLAAILLKLGGYGLMRLKEMFMKNKSMKSPLMMFCCWGALITSMLCLRQTDLKALMAYSSVGHMSLVASGIFVFSKWTISGALMLMMAHGLVSSALFALANILYERTHTRKMFMTRGFKTITTLIPLWWLMACASKLGLPPSPKLIGEIIIMSGMLGWSMWLLPIVGIATIFSAIYSLNMFQSTKTKKKVHPTKFKNIKPREHLLMLLHLLPLMPMIINPSSCFM